LTNPRDLKAFQEAADNAQEFTIPFMMAMLETMNPEDDSDPSGNEVNVDQPAEPSEPRMEL
jgi:hypothetical protein